MAIEVLYGNRKISFFGNNMSTVASVIGYDKPEFGNTFDGAVHRMKIIDYGANDVGNVDVTNVAGDKNK